MIVALFRSSRFEDAVERGNTGGIRGRRPGRTLGRLVPFLFAAVLVLSCDGQYIKGWYDDASPAKSSAGAADIIQYLFVNPVGVGVPSGGSGSADDPVIINITYPFGTSVPASDADIKIIVHPGASFAADGPWVNEDGVFIRSYTVTAQDGTQKRYQVRAVEADSTGTASSGNIGAFQFSATNGLLEGHVNTQSGAVAGVFSDPSAGVYPFTYTLENNTDLFEIVVEDDTALLKITSPLEAKSPWIIRVRVTDSAGSFYAGPVQFVVNPKGTVRPITGDFNFSRAPGGLWIHSVGGEIAGTFSAPVDESGTAPFSYELAAGNGQNDADNASFEIANGGALSIKGNAQLLAEQNPYNIYVKMTDSLGETRSLAFEFNIGVGRVMLTNHPPGTHPYTARLYAGSLDAKTFTTATAAISEGETVARSTIADVVIHGTESPAEGEGKTYALLLRDAETGASVGYFNGVTFTDGVASVSWHEVWHTFTDAGGFSAFMAAPDSTTNGGFPYRVALSGLDMKTQLSTGGSAELYSRLRSDFSYSIDFRGCSGDTFTSTASHPNAAQLREVYLGEALKTVGAYAFDGCVNMTNTRLPSVLEAIGNYAFRGCRALSDITFPETIKQIGNYAFADCTGITAVDLSGSALETVGQYAFYAAAFSGNSYPSQIASVDFSDCASLVSVGDYAFQECRQLASVSFASCASLAAIGNHAFYDNRNLATIDFSGCGELTTIGNSMISWVSFNTKLTNLDFSECVKLKTIGTDAFSYCSALTSVDFSNTTLETIGADAFYNCDNLTTVDLSAVKTTLKTIGSAAFFSCAKLATVNLSACEKLETIGSSAFYDCPLFVEAVDLTKSKTTLTTIGGSAFSSSAIVSVDLTGCTKLTAIQYGTFAFCSKLTTVTLTGCTKITTIANQTFQNCTELTTVTLSNCTNLTTIENGYDNGGSVYGVFANSTKLTTVTLTGTKIATIGNYAFYGCTALQNLLRSGSSYNSLDQIKTTLTTIGSYAFSKSGITVAQLNVCTKLATIETYAFDYCASLASIQLPATLTLVADHAFEHCSALSVINSKISNPSASIFLGTYTFSGISANFTILVPANEQIEKYRAFWETKGSWQQPASIEVP